MKKGLIFLTFLSAAALSGSGCSNKTNNNTAYSLSYDKNSNGYFITLSRFNHIVSTNSGSIGIRFDKNEYRADEPIYSNYDSVESKDGALLAKGSISSKYGTKVAFEDSFRLIEDRLLVDRKFEVVEAGEDYGFMVEQKWLDHDEARIEDKEWFIPGAYYVNGDRTFSKAATRMYFGGNELVIPADCVSSLMASSLNGKFSVTMLDTTPGHLETDIVDSHTTDTSYLHISDNFNFSGILLRNEDKQNSISHIYPSYSNNKKDFYIYRMLPVEKGLTRQISYSMFLNEFSSFNEMEKTMWRKTYSNYNLIDKRYHLSEVYSTLLDYVKNSYSENNDWGNIPQYMTKADHYFPDSGFLYCNIEFATMMLRYGTKIHDQTVIDNAIKVINYQIDNDKIDSKVTAYQRTNSVFKRVLFDGLSSTVDLYEYLVNSNFPNEELKTKVFNYILNKAELYKSEQSLMAVSFYTRLYNVKELTHLDYDETALRLINEAIRRTVNYDGYYGGVENDSDQISVLEDYMIFLRGALKVYERNKQKKYLDEAIRFADYVETYNFIQPMNLNPIGTKGNEGFNSGFIGNERFLANGYAFNNSSHYILDCCNTSNVIEFMKLYNLTGDSHYKEFAEFKLYNSTIYINMGDKVGHMDDPIHSSGFGFINEFAGPATRTEGYADGGIRGAVHDSVIGWNIYQTLYPLIYLDEIGYEGLNSDTSLVHNIAKNKVIDIENDNLIHTVYSVNDNLSETYFEGEANTKFVMDLYEQSFIDNVVISGNGNVNVEISSDNITFESVSNLNSIKKKARFVRFNLINKTQINDIAVNGYPVKYKTLSASASILKGSGNAINAIDQSNYSTVWTAGSSSSTNELLLDLNEIHEIYQTAIMFMSKNATYSYKIEISINGTDFELYAQEEDSKFVFVNQKYTKAQFVKLTILSSSEASIQIKDFKVMGD